MMRVLLVEDDPTFGPFLVEQLGLLEAGIQVNHVGSKDSAFAALPREAWDLVVCDLKLPAEDGGLEADVAHGLAVVSQAVTYCHGTPVIVLSAFQTFEIAQRLALDGTKEKIYGGDQEHLLTFFQKGQLDQCLETARHHAKELERLSGIEVKGTDDQPIRRVLRVFAAHYHGERVVARPIGGGLSSARVMRVEVFRGDARVAAAVARVTSKSEADQETAAYERFIPPMLPNWLFAPLAHKVVGTSNTIGLFYTIISGGETTLFDVLHNGADKAAAVVEQLRDGTQNWKQGAAVEKLLVRDLRRMFISDDDFANVRQFLDGTPWEDVEARTISVRLGPEHNDLHGLNVLVENNRPVMIDYGEVGRRPLSVDPITLELSVFFHPKGNGCPTDARMEILAGRWWSGQPVGALALFVEACRQWASDVAAGEREQLASAYSYVVRQLKYQDTDKELAAAIGRAAIVALRDTF